MVILSISSSPAFFLFQLLFHSGFFWRKSMHRAGHIRMNLINSFQWTSQFGSLYHRNATQLQFSIFQLVCALRGIPSDCIDILGTASSVMLVHIRKIQNECTRVCIFIEYSCRQFASGQNRTPTECACVRRRPKTVLHACMHMLNTLQMRSDHLDAIIIITYLTLSQKHDSRTQIACVMHTRKCSAHKMWSDASTCRIFMRKHKIESKQISCVCVTAAVSAEESHSGTEARRFLFFISQNTPHEHHFGHRKFHFNAQYSHRNYNGNGRAHRQCVLRTEVKPNIRRDARACVREFRCGHVLCI